MSDNCLGRSFLERYQKCDTAAEVYAMQEAIMDELERDYTESRKERGLSLDYILFIPRFRKTFSVLMTLTLMSC